MSRLKVTSSKFHALILGAAVALAAGCTVGPNYHRPEVDVPAQWSATSAASQPAALQPIAETPASTTAVTWWKTFNDPTLDTLIAGALANNFDIQIASSRVREARAQQGIINASFWPTVDASGSYARERVSGNGFPQLPNGTSRTTNLYQTGFDALWEIDVFGGTRRANEAANAEIESAVFNHQDVRVSLIAEVARNYVDARSYQRRLAIARLNIQTQRESLNVATDRERNGLGTGLDVEQATTVLAETESQIPGLETGFYSSVHRLSLLLGQPPGALLAELSPEAAIPTASLSVPAGLPSDLLRRRADIRAAERDLAASNARIGEAVSEFFPKFSITGNMGLQSTSAGEWFTGTSAMAAIGPTIRWRILDAGRIASNVEVQNARQQQSLFTYRKTILAAFEEVENALVAVGKEQAHHAALERAVTASQESLRLSNQVYAAGMSSFLAVLDAERTLYRAQDELVQSDRATAQSVIALYKALGGGWDEAHSPSDQR